MNEIRKNNEQEEELVVAKLKMPWILKVYYWILIVISGLWAFIGMIVLTDGESAAWMIVGLVMQALAILIFRMHSAAIKQSSLIITNKRIKGVKSIFLSKKAYSYRLDEIDNVEVVSNIFGEHKLSLHFLQGRDTEKDIAFSNNTGFSGGNTFITNNVSNHTEVFEKLSGLLCERKNEKDLQIDIEMERIAAEKSKAEALSSMVVNMGNKEQTPPINNDYIEQLKKIKELLDAGVITQEEFDAKKKQLLGL